MNIQRTLNLVVAGDWLEPGVLEQILATKRRGMQYLIGDLQKIRACKNDVIVRIMSRMHIVLDGQKRISSDLHRIDVKENWKPHGYDLSKKLRRAIELLFIDPVCS